MRHIELQWTTLLKSYQNRLGALRKNCEKEIPIRIKTMVQQAIGWS